MLTQEMSVVQQRTKKLQKIISETSFDDSKLQAAFEYQIYDSNSRRLPFRRVFARRHDKCYDVASLDSSQPNSVASSRPSTSPKDAQSQPYQLHCRRVLVIFIRHFLCGLCQEYLTRLSSHPFLNELNLAQHNVSVTIIGCGSPSHIRAYSERVHLPSTWTLYADPSAGLYNILGMQRSMKMGDKRPAYLQRTLTGTMLRSLVQGIKRMPQGDLSRAGAWDVQGGEYLFESRSENEEWRLRWSHQMGNSRDHTEVDDLVAVLGLSSTPNSPVRAVMSDTGPKIHNRTFSTPLMTGNGDVLDQKFRAQAPIKRQFSLRASMSTRRKSWMAISTSLSARRRSHIGVATT